ncbi:MAG: PEP-CTERM sorting domain-containing protein [Gallionellaceae bacterium]|nr:PEP-CTERM sorting domain-containing protein [Gallionellaceae bacterium]
MKRLATLFCLALSASAANAAILSFEDVPGATAGYYNNPIPDDYAGYDWTGFYVTDTTYLAAIRSGNSSGITDGAWAASNGGGSPASVTGETLFNFYCADFTRLRFSTAATLTLIAYSGGVPLYTDSFTIGATPVTKSYSWTGIDRLEFIPSVGTLGTNVAIDRLNLVPVPEPETYALMLAGLSLIGAVARRHKRRQTA